MKISIITVNKNNREGLKNTIRSVSAQSTAPHEFIVIDGGSTDGSCDLLKGHSAITYSVSEQDDGIYNAMNKGVNVATGDWCLFLNSGDTLHDSEVLSRLMASGAEADIICGNAVIMETIPRRKAAPSEITFRYLFETALCHQAVFIRTGMLRSRPYDEKYPIVADRKFFLESLILDSCSYKAVDVDVCDYDVSGLSARNRFGSQREWESCLSELIPPRVLADYGYDAHGPLYGSRSYERMFLEIGRRRWRRPVYLLVRFLLSFASLFVPSAQFIRAFPENSEN